LKPSLSNSKHTAARDNPGMSTYDLPAVAAASAKPTARACPAQEGLSLGGRLQLMAVGLLVLCVAALLWLQIDATRRSLHAHDIRVLDTHGRLLYRAPAATDQDGRSAPDWYSALVAPPRQRQLIQRPDGPLTLEIDPSRAVLDSWDEFRALVSVAGAGALLLLGGVSWWARRALRPFASIVAVLARIEQGDLRARLPVLPGQEAAAIGAAINRLSAAIQGHLTDQRRAAEVERALTESRELARQLEHHLEHERREMARELHDELAQSVTTLRSLAGSLMQQLGQRDPQSHELARLIGSEALRLDAAMLHRLPRLAPLALDHLNLADGLNSLVAHARQREPELAITLHVDAALPELDRDTALVAYRVVQEALDNAMRHSGADRITIVLSASERLLDVSISDDGQGFGIDGSEPLQHPDRHGLRGLRERVRALGGRFELASPSAIHTIRGLRVHAWLPLQPGSSTGPGGAPRA
jgi:two-component system sensor histidine kinase UhpB